MRDVSTSKPSKLHPFIKRRTAHGISRGLGRVTLCLTLLGLGVSGLGLSACSETQHVALGQCGNRIVEGEEDCDGTSNCSATCHFTCKDNSDCPSGWGCDIGSNICQTARGSFTETPLATDRRSSLLAADFDLDGRTDLLSFNPDRGELSTVYFFDRRRALERSVSLPAGMAAAIADIAGDKNPDIVLSGDGACAFQASRARSFSPLVGALQQLSSDAKLLAADLDCDGLREILLFGGGAAKTAHTVYRIDGSGELAPLSGALAIAAAELVQLESPDAFFPTERELSATGPVALSGKACEMLALPAPPGTSAVDIYASLDGGSSITGTARVTYEGEGQPARWFFADLDGDELADLVIGGSVGQWVSHGLGNGKFEPTATPLEAFSEVLAAGELDAKPGVDLFFGDGSGEPYRQARALDITGDSLTDVAAVSDAERVDIFRGHKTGRSSRLAIPTFGIPRIADVGDFDADGADDLLLTTSKTTEGPKTRASIVFSPVTSQGASTLEVGSFESIQQLVAGYWSNNTPNPDAAGDIGALFSTTQGQLQLGILEGGADRLLRSRLPSGTHNVFGPIPGGPALGRFHPDVGMELAIVKSLGLTDEPLSVELLKVDKGGLTFERSVRIDGVTYATLPAAFKPGVVALNLDANDAEELYVASTEGVVRLDADGDGFSVEPTAKTTSLVVMDAQDANADGLLDLLVVDKTSLSVFLATRDGPEKHVFDLDAFQCPRMGPDLAFIQADDDGAFELLFDCYPSGDDFDFIFLPSTEELAGLGLEARLYDVDWTQDTLGAIGTVPDLFGGHFVSGDFDGDGVQDFASGAPNLTVRFGEPRQGQSGEAKGP
jgi:hypothetical protein